MKDSWIACERRAHQRLLGDATCNAQGEGEGVDCLLRSCAAVLANQN
jgi:hypothetical protein